MYREARTEKDARAEEYSAVKRALARDTIVIADGLNYIKGFRYQLYCEAKAVQTPSCVVIGLPSLVMSRWLACVWGLIELNRLTTLEIHVGTPVDKCQEVNSTRLADADQDRCGYATDYFDNLIYRYEEPNGMTRWDSPLFTVLYDDETPPLDAIWDALIGSDRNSKTIKPHQATVLV